MDNQFSFQFVDRSSPSEFFGEIVIGDSFRESFVAGIGYWNEEDYLKQWKNALERIRDGHSKSAFLTSVLSKNFAEFAWLMYQVSETVYFQNLLLNPEVEENFDEKNPFDFIEDRVITSEDGRKISEWKIDKSQVLNFLEQNF